MAERSDRSASRMNKCAGLTRSYETLWLRRFTLGPTTTAIVSLVQHLDFQVRMIPGYWEPAELLPDYVSEWQARAAGDDGYETSCRRCGRTSGSSDVSGGALTW